MQETNAAARLTDREKECLRLWLDRRTAKEIGRELGISHHAVEKRLKTARTKLDVASSLEAARLLAQAESYGQAVTGATDLRSDRQTWRSRQRQPLVIGGIAMCLTTFLALALVPADRPASDNEPVEAASGIRIDTDAEPIFALIDSDGSGFLENPESPFVTAAIAPGSASDESPDAERLAEFYAAADRDGDGRISFREFHSWHGSRLAEMGIESTGLIEVRPAPES
ncbi:MAG: LuxR C-terminal-related transcriptional regulator [Erythrobacter sp.]|jgi:DNA-binding CsgD family transcriptional regulator|nr:LuxR C-terminal-related transcriptional regulator [Erythrobacter sp.]